jgi:hypothetical protein
MFWDHDARWCIAVGHDEIDFSFSILDESSTYWIQFSEGISKVKQVTGREHRDIQP